MDLRVLANATHAACPIVTHLGLGTPPPTLGGTRKITWLGRMPILDQYSSSLFLPDLLPSPEISDSSRGPLMKINEEGILSVLRKSHVCTYIHVPHALRFLLLSTDFSVSQCLTRDHYGF